MDVTRRTQITHEQFEARQQAARERWQATMSGRRPARDPRSAGGRLVAHGAVRPSRRSATGLPRNNVKASCGGAGCIGTRLSEPQVDIIMPGQPRISYSHITADKVPELLESVLNRGDMRPDWAFCVYGTRGLGRLDAGYQGIPAAQRARLLEAAESASSCATWATSTRNRLTTTSPAAATKLLKRCCSA